MQGVLRIANWVGEFCPIIPRIGNPAEIGLLNPGSYSEWMSSGQGYVVYGEGPALQGAWVCDDSSNCLCRAGRIISVSIRGKGQPCSNMQGRKCN